MADPAFVCLIYGTDDVEAVARWHCAVARTLREHLCREYGELFRNSVAWTVGELLAVREVQRERRRRNSDGMAEFRRRQKR